jgi:hypothetical protein
MDERELVGTKEHELRVAAFKSVEKSSSSMWQDVDFLLPRLHPASFQKLLYQLAPEKTLAAIDGVMEPIRMPVISYAQHVFAAVDIPIARGVS